MRKTKIICTLGPATEKTEILRQLIQKGTDVFRLNMSHASHDWVREIVPRIRTLAQKADRPVALLLDTQGPAIRTGDLKANLHLKPGDILEFTVDGAKSKERYSVDVNYRGFADDVTVGNTILVDNGLIKLLVLSKARNRVRCKVLTRAILGSRRHINLPGVHVNLPSLTRKDLADVSLSVEIGADFIGLSFVRKKSDIEQLRNLLLRKKSKAQIVAKIEDQLAVRSIDKMIESTDVIMVARGDLGIECPMEELPIIQRRIVKNCLRLGKPVIIATQLLESMITNPLPTRAEITDVANAVFEQADALMLSGETTIGRYPVECVEILRRVAVRTERSGGAGYAENALLENIRQKMVASAVTLANSLHDSKLIVFTLQGRMARYVSNLRPQRAPIFAFTPSEEVYRQLALYWGTFPARVDFSGGPDRAIAAAEKFLRKNKWATPGDHMVIISDVRMGRALVDSIQLRMVK
ncbi:MAG: pyruvate kinase [Verrucomicrobia bacterium]|jgi:pyruvate kinase|nr:MAG: pyruvate kinase [Verrucomicrobia bacterium 13_2_20CM_54_12]OLD72915.1 MAG: pyruvate kinase [Verrucomicrobia bacterium 13_1_20CM_54_28]OLD85277.1 MAG: pyruvate kinase [Verrucomicrobia bacterium 13_1_20CM_4_54_11]OLE12866.1 MAG: pyruvate kinase [Verrucomicrobia bacterium 13_1_20CM_3_54_17]PYK15167.1 MAG: pyruvate kinase [Verrucomicrobiota bacterium]